MRMKAIVLGISVVSVPALLTSAQNALAQTSYPLTCRGGPMQYSYSSNTKELRMRFAAGTGAAFDGVAAGECTWSDRGFRQGEPTQICQRPVELNIGWRTEGWRVTSLGSSPVNYVQSLASASNTLIFQVYNDGAGCMRVTRIGP